MVRGPAPGPPLAGQGPRGGARWGLVPGPDDPAETIRVHRHPLGYDLTDAQPPRGPLGRLERLDLDDLLITLVRRCTPHPGDALLQRGVHVIEAQHTEVDQPPAVPRGPEQRVPERRTRGVDLGAVPCEAAHEILLCAETGVIAPTAPGAVPGPRCRRRASAPLLLARRAGGRHRLDQPPGRLDGLGRPGRHRVGVRGIGPVLRPPPDHVPPAPAPRPGPAPPIPA